MALQGLCGFEQGGLGEFSSVVGTPSIQTSIVRSGTYAMRINAPGVPTYAVYHSRPAGGVLANNFKSAQFYVYVNGSYPVTNAAIWSIGPNGGPPTAIIRLDNSAGQLDIQVVGGATDSGTEVLRLNQWNLVELSVGSATDTNLWVNGVLSIANSGLLNAEVARPEMRLGQGVSAGYNEDFDLIFDDVRWHDATFSRAVGGYRQLPLLPTAGNNANSWTGGAGGTGDLHAAVGTRPPGGLAPASETNASQIKNAASGSNLDYTATMQSYSVAGVPPGSVINAVQASCNDGEEITTGTKAGGLWIASNPAQSAATTTFDYGDDTATVVAGYPVGWATHLGVVSTAPSVTLGTAPTVTVRKVGSTTRVVDADFMAIMVDFTPPPIANPVTVLQAQNRASRW